MKNSAGQNQQRVIGKAEQVTKRRRFVSHELFGVQNEIVIEHNNDEYRLRITSNGKLILTK
ncbi:MAG: hemin uptake protein HemP [Methylococcaceae bacterium]